jgi:hypothetical protein
MTTKTTELEAPPSIKTESSAHGVGALDLYAIPPAERVPLESAHRSELTPLARSGLRGARPRRAQTWYPPAR